jgi:hypothetical protein
MEDQIEYQESDKQLLMAEFLNGMTRCNDLSIVKLLNHSLYLILQKDHEKWTNYQECLLKILTENPSHEKIYCGLLGYNSLMKVFQYFVDEDRDPINDSIAVFFPFLKDLLANLLKDFTPVNAILVHEIVKIFSRAVRVFPRIIL